MCLPFSSWICLLLFLAQALLPSALSWQEWSFFVLSSLSSKLKSTGKRAVNKKNGSDWLGVSQSIYKNNIWNRRFLNPSEETERWVPIVMRKKGDFAKAFQLFSTGIYAVQSPKNQSHQNVFPPCFLQVISLPSNWQEEENIPGKPSHACRAAGFLYSLNHDSMKEREKEKHTSLPLWFLEGRQRSWRGWFQMGLSNCGSQIEEREGDL